MPEDSCLKRLQEQRSRLIESNETLEKEDESVQAKISRLQKLSKEYHTKIESQGREIARIDREVEIMEKRSSGLVISTHAIQRYILRSYGISEAQIKEDTLSKYPVEKLKEEMLEGVSVQLITELGDGEYPNARGMRLIIKNHTVVTVLSEREKHRSQRGYK